MLVLVCGAASAADPSAELLSSSARGQTDRVTSLLGAGANLEAKDKRGRTPLMLAAQHGHADTVRLLLAKGADPDARDRAGWTAYGLILAAPAGDLFRKHQADVLPLLPAPPRWRLAAKATWIPEALFSSCFLGREQLLEHVAKIRPDDLALAAFQSVAKVSGSDFLQIVDGDPDATLTLQVKPGATCSQTSGDSLSLSIEIGLIRVHDQAALFRSTFRGGLKGLHVRGVTNPSQYFSIYEGWAKSHAGPIYRSVLAELLKSTQ